MRDTIALALVRAELCRAQAAAHRRRLELRHGDSGTWIGRSISTMHRMLFLHDRGTRPDQSAAHESGSPPD
jgi:hypothetical protein